MRSPLARVAALVLCVAACGPHRLTSSSHLIDAGCKASADGATLRCGDRAFAFVECYGDDGRVAARRLCRALAVRYDDGERAWLYRPGEFDPEHLERYHRPDKVDLDRASDVTVALDASEITFFRRTPFTRGGVQRYDVGSGILTDVERADEWRIWAAVHENRAMELGGARAARP